MADAMDVDAPVASASKVAKGKAAGGKEGAERFQVKKVSFRVLPRCGVYVRRFVNRPD